MTSSRDGDVCKVESNLELLKNEGYELIKFDNQLLENEIYRWIALKRDHVLGRGSYGSVFEAYPVNPKTGEIIKKKFAVKIYRDTSHVNPNEAKFFDSYYPGCELISTGNDIYMIMACLPGKAIMDNDKRRAFLNVEILQFDFAKRVDLAYNIMLAMHLIHRKTPSTGNALVHGDINGSNIKVHYDRETGKIGVYIVDFGLSEEIEDNPDIVKPAQMAGAPLFMPSELYSEQDKEVHGIKSDIYALTPIFAAVFGASDPFAIKTKCKYWERAYYEAPYDFTGIFTGFDMPESLFCAKDYIIKFLSRMQNLSIEKRPDSDEVLRFFTTLNKLCKTTVVNDKHEDIPMCCAILATLADGVWKGSEFDKDDSDKIVLNDSGAAQKVTAPEYFDFEGPENAATCASIVRVAKKTPLNTPILKRIMSKENAVLSRQKSTIFTKQIYNQAVSVDEKNESDVVLTDDNKSDSDELIAQVKFATITHM